MNLRTLAVVVALALSVGDARAQALQSTNLTFQGLLQQSGAPLTGLPNLEFRLVDSVGSQVGPTLSRPNWPVSGGQLIVDLDFGSVFNGQQRFLSISINGTALTPAVPLASTPYALAAQTTLGNSVNGASIVDSTIGPSDVNAATVQLRVQGSCTAGNAVRVVNQDGTVVCESVSGATGDITGILTPAAGGLTGGTASGEATLSIRPLGVTGAMIGDGQVGSTNVQDGALLAVDINSTQIQRRVTSVCLLDSFMRSINVDGTVTCQSAAPSWDRTGNPGTNEFVDFVGTTDNQALQLRANNVIGLRLQPAGTRTPSVVMSALSSAVGTALPASAVVAGRMNRVLDEASVVLGGINNDVGLDDGNQLNQERSVIIGGNNNLARGLASTVIGGDFSQASGNYSLAAGARAKALHLGAFVWSSQDGAAPDFSSTGNSQFLVRAPGGVGFNTAPPNNQYEMTVKALSVNADIQLSAAGTAAMEGIQLTATAGTGLANDSEFVIAQSVPGSLYVERLRIQGDGDLVITGANAIKPGGGTWIAPSDRRIKHNIAPIANALDTVMQLRPITFHYTEAYRMQSGGLADKNYRGFIAQEFAEIFPEAVNATSQQLPDSNAAGGDKRGETILALDANPALITTIAAVQELAVADEDATARIAMLEKQVAELRIELEAFRNAQSAPHANRTVADASNP